MYSAVRTNEYDYPESEMDEHDSIYFDTISLADSEVAAAHRKSLSQSRNTIYHSAVDLDDDETPNKGRSLKILNNLENGNNSKRNANSHENSWNPYYRHSSALEKSRHNGGHELSTSSNVDYTDAAIAAQMQVIQNGRFTINAATMIPTNANDEVSRQLLQSRTNSLNKDKKLPITYSQWKSRTRRRFQDGKRSVDFVLAYNGDDFRHDHVRKREVFEANLIREGLHLEHDKSQRIHFIKLHAPLDILCRYAEILKIKLPIKKIPGEELIFGCDNDLTLSDGISRLCAKIFQAIRLDPKKFPPRPKTLHCEFSRNYQHLFDIERPNFFDAGTRNCIINFILERQHFIEGEETPDNLGIEKLLTDGVYESAYTLHDDNDRDLLLSEWANLTKWIHIQPLDNIKEYFGAKVALYFAWLGFYTHMLIPVSIFGIICFVYGLWTLNEDPISQQICTSNQTILMCPLCDRNCDYWELQATCKYSKINYLIDNSTTVVFACVMSIWAVLYLELWKRYSANLIHRWGLTGFSQHVEHPRPQYLAKIRNTKTMDSNFSITSNTVLEPDVPFWRVKFLPDFTSYGIMLLFISISLIAIFSMTVYRMAQKASHSILGNEDSMTFKIMVLPMTAGIIDLIVISMLDQVYVRLAVYLTNLEYRRTQTEYDESLTIKNYIFQFVNYYASLFYIAFLKGKFVGYPAKYNRILGFRQEECHPGGCLMELCMQLVIIMVGKQAVGAIIEMLFPYLLRQFRKFATRFGVRPYGGLEREKKLISCNQWTEDYHLLPWTSSLMFSEYLEMVLQFGFITIFGLAFPLAPLLALINNVIEVRLDAIKMLKLTRRPVAQRAKNIGVWFNILTILTKIAVAANAMIIAFSTNLIPKLIFHTLPQEEQLSSYLDFTLAHFNTKDFQVEPILAGSPYENVTSCRYAEFRNPPEHSSPYKRPLIYWKILTARLAFIVIFQNIIGVIQTVISWAIPDVAGRLRKRIKREEFLVREHIIEFEKRSATDQSRLMESDILDGVRMRKIVDAEQNHLPQMGVSSLRRRNDDSTTSFDTSVV